MQLTFRSVKRPFDNLSWRMGQKAKRTIPTIALKPVFAVGLVSALIALTPMPRAVVAAPSNEQPAAAQQGTAPARLINETVGNPIPGYADYSYDKNSILFNVSPEHGKMVFFDTIYPFDTTLRYNNTLPLVRYELDHTPFVKDGALMVALQDLRKAYAPYFSYAVDDDQKTFSIEHHYFKKKFLTAPAAAHPPSNTPNWSTTGRTL